MRKCLSFLTQSILRRLFEIVGVKKTWKAKNTPTHSQILECFESAELSSCDASSVPKCSRVVGILLYLSADLVECQFTIRRLAQHMSKHTEKAWIALKYLAQYVLGCIEHG